MSFKNIFCIFVILAGSHGICLGGKDDLTVTMHAVKKCIERSNSGNGRSHFGSSDGLSGSGRSEELAEWLEEEIASHDTTRVHTPRSHEGRKRTGSTDDES